MSTRVRDLTRRHDLAAALAVVSGLVGLGLALALATGAGTIASSPTFEPAAGVAPITTWAAGFAFAGVVVLATLWRRPDELALALLVLALLTLLWAGLAAWSIPSGGLTSGVAAYLGLAAYQGLAALAAVHRAEELAADRQRAARRPT